MHPDGWRGKVGLWPTKLSCTSLRQYLETVFHITSRYHLFPAFTTLTIPPFLCTSLYAPSFSWRPVLFLLRHFVVDVVWRRSSYLFLSSLSVLCPRWAREQPVLRISSTAGTVAAWTLPYSAQILLEASVSRSVWDQPLRPSSIRTALPPDLSFCRDLLLYLSLGQISPFSCHNVYRQSTRPCSTRYALFVLRTVLFTVSFGC